MNEIKHQALERFKTKKFSTLSKDEAKELERIFSNETETEMKMEEDTAPPHQLTFYVTVLILICDVVGS